MSIFSDAWNKIKKPFEDLSHGDLGGFVSDSIHLIPAVVINDALDGIKQTHLYVGNNSGMSLSVVVSMNRDWVGVDFLSVVAQMALGDEEAGWEEIKNAKNIYELYKATKTLRNTASASGKLWQLFSRLGTEIKFGQSVDVYQRTESNPLAYLNPSQYAMLMGASDVSMILMLENEKSALFNANSRDSWLVDEVGYVKAKYSNGMWTALPPLIIAGDESDLVSPVWGTIHRWDN